MDNAWITFGKAMVLKNRGRHAEAKKLFEHLIAKDLLTGTARIQLGKIYYENGDIDRAIKEYLYAKQIQAFYAESITYLVELYFDQNNFSQLDRLVEQETESGRNCIDMLINIGGRYRSKGMLGKAIHLFEKTIYWFPNDSLAKLNLGELYRETGALENAKRLFIELTESGEERLLSAYINLGLTYGLQGLLKEAKNAFDFVMERDSDNFLCRLYQAIVFRENGRIEKAVTIFHELLISHPNNLDLTFNLALSYVQDGRFSDAIDCFKEIAADEHDSFINQFYLGVINRECGLYSVAETIFSNLLKEDSNHVGAMLNYALCFGALEKHSLAIEKINRLLELDPGNPVAKLFLGVFHRQNGNVDNAMKIFRSLMDDFDGHISAGINLSLCLALRGKSNDAVQLIESFYNSWPQNLSILMQYGIIDREIGEYDEAISRFTQLLTIHPNNTQAIIFLALSYAAIRHFDKALDTLKKSLSYPDHLFIKLNLGIIHRDFCRYHEAEHFLSGLVRTSGGHVGVTLNTALCHGLKGNVASGVALIENILSSDPKHFFAKLNLGIIYRYAGNFFKAESIFSDLQSYEANCIGLRLEKALCWSDLGKVRQAKNLFGSAMDDDSKNILIRFHYAIFLRNSGEFHESVRILSDLNKSHPNNLDMKLQLALSLALTNEFERAKKIVESVIEHPQMEFWGSYFMGIIYRESREYEQSLTLFNALLKHNKDHFNTYLQAGMTYQRMGKLSDAISFYERVLAIYPENFPAKVLLCTLLSEIGKNIQADSIFRSLLYREDGSFDNRIGNGNTFFWISNLGDSLKMSFGKTLTSLNKHQEAVTLYAEICKNNPTNQEALLKLHLAKDMHAREMDDRI